MGKVRTSVVAPPCHGVSHLHFQIHAQRIFTDSGALQYTSFIDSYMSLVRSLEHAAMACRRKLQLVLIDASKLEPATQATEPAEYDEAWELVRSAGGALVPSGFGSRGTEGMIAAIRWARENRTPFLGICLGMQLAVVDFARNICNIPFATSAEFVTDSDADTTRGDNVVIYMPELDRSRLGGTMRLGLRPTHFCDDTEGSKIRRLYAAKTSTFEESAAPDAPPIPSPNSDIMPGVGQGESSELIEQERHRHRYEVNPVHVKTLESCRMHVVGKNETGIRTEAVKISDHSWFCGCSSIQSTPARFLSPTGAFWGSLRRALVAWQASSWSRIALPNFVNIARTDQADSKTGSSVLRVRHDGFI